MYYLIDTLATAMTGLAVALTVAFIMFPML